MTSTVDTHTSELSSTEPAPEELVEVCRQWTDAEGQDTLPGAMYGNADRRLNSRGARGSTSSRTGHREPRKAGRARKRGLALVLKIPKDRMKALTAGQGALALVNAPGKTATRARVAAPVKMAISRRTSK